MMVKSFLLVILVALALCVEGFRQSFGVRCQSLARVTQKHLAKPDLFSDDLFDDDADSEKPSKDPLIEREPPKRKYLEQKWKLNSEDAKEFKGFPKQEVGGAPEKVEDDDEDSTAVPVFALMYKFRREYLETSVDAVLADHNGHCAKFKRLINSEMINLGKAKGVVTLWGGYTEDDAAETRAEIMSFLEDDPLIVKDVVENWDIIDLGKKVDALPAGPKS